MLVKENTFFFWIEVAPWMALESKTPRELLKFS